MPSRRRAAPHTRPAGGGGSAVPAWPGGAAQCGGRQDGPAALSAAAGGNGAGRCAPGGRGPRDDRRPAEPGAGHARQPALGRRLSAARPAQAAGVPHAASLHRHRQQLLRQPAALRPAGALPLRARRRPLPSQAGLRPGLRGRLRLLWALRRRGLAGRQRLREGGVRARGADRQREAQEGPQAAHHLLQLPAGGPAAPLPEDTVPGAARARRAGRLPRPHSDPGEDLVPEPPLQVQEDVEERRAARRAAPAPQRLAAAPCLAARVGLRPAPACGEWLPRPRRGLPRQLRVVPARPLAVRRLPPSTPRRKRRRRLLGTAGHFPFYFF